jgi:tRNA (guanine37-N1)-methyltransferase
MVMTIEPLIKAIQAARQASPQASVVYLSPQGQKFDQRSARQLAQRQALVLVAGRYEGIDERLLAHEVDEQWSIGDYVLSGGELAAMVLIDAMTRLLPGALGDERSAELESFNQGLLDYPQYTRPEVYQGMAVPEVLLSGNHQKIAHWRNRQALLRTWQQRPDLLQQATLTKEQQQLLAELLE